jgi:hypothetical protein
MQHQMGTSRIEMLSPLLIVELVAQVGWLTRWCSDGLVSCCIPLSRRVAPDQCQEGDVNARELIRTRSAEINSAWISHAAVVADANAHPGLLPELLGDGNATTTKQRSRGPR